MKKKIVTVLPLALIINGCIYQHPAPIEFEDMASPSPVRSSSGIVSHKLDVSHLTSPPQPLAEPQNLNSGISKDQPTAIIIEDDKASQSTTNLDSELEKLDIILPKEQPNLSKPVTSVEDKPKLTAKKIETREANSIITQGLLELPTKGKVINKFGEVVNNKKLNGVNIAAPAGTPVKTVHSGTVIYLGEDATFGKLLIIKQTNGDLLAAYAHLADFKVTKNTKVERGEIIGHVGSTGNAKQPMLHFAISKGNNELIDPLPYLK